MADVTVRTATLELRTCKLTKSLLKQIPELKSLRGLVDDKGKELKDKVVGWVHGSVLGEDWQTWLIFSLGEGCYGKYEVMQSKRDLFPQIYIV